MRDRLPAWVDLIRLAPGQHIAGTVPLSDLEGWPAGEASVQLRLDITQAPSGRLALKGDLQGQCEMQCQRCLQPMQQVWNTQFQLEMVDNEEQAQRIETALDIYIAHGGRVHLHELAMDESILALPMTPRHADGTCEPPAQS